MVDMCGLYTSDFFHVIVRINDGRKLKADRRDSVLIIHSALDKFICGRLLSKQWRSVH